MRGRGLKRFGGCGGGNISVVAPHAGAWIETGTWTKPADAQWVSPLMRGRGLKPGSPAGAAGRWDVAPHAGAWIETLVAGIGLEPAFAGL